jgi:hypothetical protein
MELVHPGEVVREQEEVEGKVDHEWDGWAAPKQGQALEENACVQNVERLLLMKPEHPVTL